MSLPHHPPAFDPAGQDDDHDGELIATCDEPADGNADYDGISRRLYVTEQRKFFIVEHFFSFDGRPATSRKTVSLEQARAWCVACGLHPGTVDRYLNEAPLPGAAPDSVSLLTQRWL